MTHQKKPVIAVKSIVASRHLTIPAGASGHVVDSSFIGTPKRVRFTLHNDAGEQDVTVKVKRGDVA